MQLTFLHTSRHFYGTGLSLISQCHKNGTKIKSKVDFCSLPLKFILLIKIFDLKTCIMEALIKSFVQSAYGALLHT